MQSETFSMANPVTTVSRCTNIMFAVHCILFLTFACCLNHGQIFCVIHTRVETSERHRSENEFSGVTLTVFSKMKGVGLKSVLQCVDLTSR